MKPASNFIAFLIIVLLVAPAKASAAEPRSDKDKKQHVYELYEGYKKKFPEIREISPTAVQASLTRGDKLLFIDVRKEAERVVSTLPGAISKETFLAAEKRYANHVLIAYCTIGYRSGLFAQDMRERGLDIQNLRGGILAWTLEGGEVYREERLTGKIHVFSKKWNYAPEGYGTESFSLLEQFLP